MLNKMHKGDKAPKGKAVASVEIKGAGDMLVAERVVLANWLRAQAALLLTDGCDYDRKFKGEFLV